MLRIWLLCSLLNTVFASLASDIVKSRDLDKILEYVSPHELVDTVFEDLAEEYPVLRPEAVESEKLNELKKAFPEMKHPPPVEQANLLKLQLVYWLTAEQEERDEVMDRFYDKFSLFHDFIKTGYKIAERKSLKLNDDKKKVMKDDEGYALHRMFKPVYRLLDRKIASYESRGLTKEEIKAEIDKARVEYDEKWEDWKRDTEDPEHLQDIWKSEKHRMQEKDLRMENIIRWEEYTREIKRRNPEIFSKENKQHDQEQIVIEDTDEKQREEL